MNCIILALFLSSWSYGFDIGGQTTVSFGPSEQFSSPSGILTPSEPLHTPTYLICGQSPSNLFSNNTSGSNVAEGLEVEWLEYCQDDFDKYFNLDYGGAFNTNSSTNLPPRVGGSGWALLLDGEADLLRGYITNSPPKEGMTWMWWMQGMEFSYFHELISITGMETDEPYILLNCEFLLDLWVDGTSALAEDFWGNFRFANVAFPGMWVHTVVTWDNSGESYTYINGVLVGVTHVSPDAVFDFITQVAVVGSTCVSNGYQPCNQFAPHLAYSGMFDELQLYNYVLSAEEVNATFSTGQRASPGPVLDLSLNDEGGKGTVARDRSGYGHDFDFAGIDVTELFDQVEPSDELLELLYWDLSDAEAGAGPTWIASTVPTIGLGDFVFSVPKDQQIGITLPAFDPDGDPLVWTVAEVPVNGTLYQTTDGEERGGAIASGSLVTHESGLVIYAPDPSAFSGEPLTEWALHPNVNPIRDKFRYCVNDTAGHSECADAYVLQNQPPYARSERSWIQEDADVIWFFPCFDQDGDLPQVIITSIEGRGHVYDHDYYVFPIPPEDVYPSHNLRAYAHDDIPFRRFPFAYGEEITSFPHNLTDIGRRVIFSPLEEDYGTDYVQMTYYCVDKFNQSSQEAVLWMDVYASNDAPVAEDIETLVQEDSQRIITLQATDSDSEQLQYFVSSIPDAAEGSLYTVKTDRSMDDPIETANNVQDLVQYSEGVSAKKGTIYNANGVIGTPDQFPSPGQSSLTADLSARDTGSFVVSFAHAFFVTEVWIYETRDAGAIVKVALIGADPSLEVVVWEGLDFPSRPDEARIFSPTICNFNRFPVTSVRLYYDRLVSGATYPAIDAVALVGTVEPVPSRLLNNMVGFVPAPNFHGVVEITYFVDDCSDISREGHLSITVASVNDPPVAVAEPLSFVPTGDGEDCSSPVPITFEVQDVDMDATVTQIIGFPEDALMLSTAAGEVVSPSMLPLTTQSGVTFVCSVPGLFCSSGDMYNISMVTRDSVVATWWEMSALCDPPARVETVVLGVLLPLHLRDAGNDGSARYRAGTEALAAVRMAVNEINDKSDGVSDHLLSRTTLKLLFNDTRYTGGTARDGAQHMLSQRVDGVPVTVFICCEDASLSKDVYDALAASRNVIQLSYQTSSPEFDSSSTYTYFYRTIPSLTTHIDLIVQALITEEWTRFSVVYEDNVKWALTTDYLRQQASHFSLDVARVVMVSTAMAESRLENDLAPLRNTSIILLFCESVCSSVISVADSPSLNMTGNGNGYTWFTISEELDSPPLSWVNNMRGGFYTEYCNSQNEVCTEVDYSSTQGYVEGDSDSVPCKTTMESRWEAQIPICDDVNRCPCSEETGENGEYFWRETDGSACLGISFDAPPSLFSSYLYDSVYAIAMALDSVIPDTDAATVSTSTLAAALRDVSLEGTSGAVSYTQEGNRGSGECVSLYNFLSDRESVVTGAWLAEEGFINCSSLISGGYDAASSCGDGTVVYATADQSHPNAYCPDDTYLDVALEESDTYLFCLACPDGLHSYDDHMTFCSSCGDPYCPQDECSAGEYFNASVYDSCGGEDGCHCLPCEPGSFSASAGSTACQPCALGTCAPEQGLSKCLRCGDGEYNDLEGQSACRTCPPNTLRGVNTDGTSVTQCMCMEGYWDRGHEVSAARGCDACVYGGYCAGENATPVPLEGYWGDVRNVNTFWDCHPTFRCVGDFECHVGYEGFLCASCTEDFHKIANECYECPDSHVAWLWTLVSVCVEVITWYGVYRLVVATELVVQLVYCLQILWLFSLIRLEWPYNIMILFESLSVFGLKADFVSPACSVSWSYTSATAVQVIQPFMLCAPVFAFIVARRALRSGSQAAADIRAIFRSGRFLRAVVPVVDIASLPALVRVWEAFCCETIADGTTILFWAPSVACDTGTHAEVIALAVLGLLCYAVVWPAMVLSVLLWGRRRGKLTDARFLRSFSYLFGSYREYWWWYYVDWGLRVSLSIVVIPGYSQPMLQAVVCWFLVTLALCAHMYGQPFTSERANVLKMLVLMLLVCVLSCGILFSTMSSDAEVIWVCFVLLSLMLCVSGWFVLLDLEPTLNIRGLQPKHSICHPKVSHEIKPPLERGKEASASPAAQLLTPTVLGEPNSGSLLEVGFCSSPLPTGFAPWFRMVSAPTHSQGGKGYVALSQGKPKTCRSHRLSYSGPIHKGPNLGHSEFALWRTDPIYPSGSWCDAPRESSQDHISNSPSSNPSSVTAATEFQEKSATQQLRPPLGTNVSLNQGRNTFSPQIAGKALMDAAWQETKRGSFRGVQGHRSTFQGKPVMMWLRDRSSTCSEVEDDSTVVSDTSSDSEDATFSAAKGGDDRSSGVSLNSLVKARYLLAWLVSQTCDAEDPVCGKRRYIRGSADRNGDHAESSCSCGPLQLSWQEKLKKISIQAARLFHWVVGTKNQSASLKLALTRDAEEDVRLTQGWVDRVHVATSIDSASCRRCLSDPYFRILSETAAKDGFIIWLLQASTAYEREACCRVLADRVRRERTGYSKRVGGSVIVEETLAFLLYSVLVSSEEEAVAVREFLEQVARTRRRFKGSKIEELLELVAEDLDDSTDISGGAEREDGVEGTSGGEGGGEGGGDVLDGGSREKGEREKQTERQGGERICSQNSGSLEWTGEGLEPDEGIRLCGTHDMQGSGTNSGGHHACGSENGEGGLSYVSHTEGIWL